MRGARVGLRELIQQLDWSTLAFFVLFALPGFISLQVWSLIVPTAERPLKELIPEAISFGLLNAVVGAPLIAAIGPANIWALYALLLLTLIALPTAWPFILKWGLGKLSTRRHYPETSPKRMGCGVSQARAAFRNRASQGWTPYRRLLWVRLIRGRLSCVGSSLSREFVEA